MNIIERDLEIKNIYWSTKQVDHVLEDIEKGNKMPKDHLFYNGDIRLKKSDILFEYTEDEIREYVRCSEDIVYFAENYVKVKTVNGYEPLKLWDGQKRLLEGLKNHRFNVNMHARQSGVSSVTALHTLHYSIFQNDKTSLFISNNLYSSAEVLEKLKGMVEGLPFFLKPGVKVWNQKNIEFDNGCKVKAVSPRSALGYRIDNIIFDHFAHIDPNTLKTCFESLMPSMVADIDSRITITSTPNGYNKFYDVYTKALKGENEYHPTRIDWTDIPNRNKEWKNSMIKNLGGYKQFAQEFELKFVTAVDCSEITHEDKVEVYNENLDILDSKFEDIDKKIEDLVKYTEYVATKTQKAYTYSEYLAQFSDTKFDTIDERISKIESQIESLTKLVELAIKKNI